MVSKTVKRAEKYFELKFFGQNYVGQKWCWKGFVLYLIKCVGHKLVVHTGVGQMRWWTKDISVAHKFVGHESVGQNHVGHKRFGEKCD